MSKLKIAMIGHKVVPTRSGGVEVVVENLSKRMVGLGHEVTLFNRSRKESKKNKEYCGCKIINIFTINKKKFDAIVYSFFATLKVRKMVKKNKFDIVHFHAEGPCYFLWLLGKKHKNYKLVVTIHGLDWKRSKWGGFATKIILRGEKQAVKYADKIIVLSKNNQDYFLNEYNRETTIIPNGVSKPSFHTPQIITEKYNLVENSYVLFLARIVPEKGLHYLIDAWKKLNTTTNNHLKLVVAGGSSHSLDYFNEMKNKCNNDNSIIFTDFVCGQELEELFTNAYLYVLPSDIEGMPMSLLEAMSYGNTCLVSDIPENLEVITDNDYSFKAGDINDLHDKLYSIISNNKNLKKESIISYDWDEITNKTISFYIGEEK